MLVDAQPRLVAEARAQGLNLRETSVGQTPITSHQAGGGNGGAATADQGRSNGQPQRQTASTDRPAAPRLVAEVAPALTSERYA